MARARAATRNQPWGPTGTELARLADEEERRARTHRDEKAELESLRERAHALARDHRIETAHLGDEGEVLGTRELVMEDGILGRVPEHRARLEWRGLEVVSRHAHVAPVRDLESRGGAHQRALARAVGAEQSDHASRFDAQRDAGERAASAVRAMQVVDLEHGQGTSVHQPCGRRRVEWITPARSTTQPDSGIIRLAMAEKPSQP